MIFACPGRILIVLVCLAPQFLLADNIRLQSPVEQTALLELYTSEGCSSCPPADRWLSSLLGEKQLWRAFIPMAFHVDYWDYIGWKDRFANPAFSARQRQYAREQSVKTVYTPGFVMNGKEWRNWFAKRALQFPEADRVGILTLETMERQAHVVFTPGHPENEVMEVNLALLGFNLETQVLAGENRGRKLPHNFVVLGINRIQTRPVGRQYMTRIDMPSSEITAERYGIVAWVNKPGSQKPVQAVGGWLP